MNKKSMLHDTSDSILIRSWQLGDEKSFARLFHKYYQANYKYAFAITRDRMLSEEVAMDVMMAIWRRKEHINAEAPLLPFMLKSVRNRIIDQARRKKLSISPLMESAHADVLSSENNVDTYVSKKEMDKLYQQAQLILSPKRRLVFRMSRDLDLSHTEIARQMNVSRNTVENHIVFALRDIRRYLINSTFSFFIRCNKRCLGKQKRD